MPAPLDLRTIWGEMASLTSGLLADDARLPRVLDALTQAAKAQDAGDMDGFEQAVEQIRSLMRCSPGSQIEWQRAGTVQHGRVDYVHVDADGVVWAFVTIGESWTAVNMKFATVMTDASPMSADVVPPHGGHE